MFGLLFMLFGLLFLIAMIAGIAVGAAFVLEAIRPQLRWPQRAWWAALTGGFVPMLVPLVAIAANAGFGTEGVIAMVAILVAGLIASLAIGFPATYIFCRSRARARGEEGDPAQPFE